MYTFTSLIEKENQDQQFKTFDEAFRAMYKYVMGYKGSLSRQVLETCIWIKPKGGQVMNIMEARDIAIDKHILVDGKLAS